MKLIETDKINAKDTKEVLDGLCGAYDHLLQEGVVLPETEKDTILKALDEMRDLIWEFD